MGEIPLEGLSQAELEQRLAHALAVGDEAAAASVEIPLARCLLDGGDAAAARRHAERALALQRQASTQTGERDLARALEVFGRAARAGGDGDAATGAYLEAIDVAGRLGMREVVAGLLEELGAMAVSAGDRTRARDLLNAAVRTAPEPREDAARRAELGLARIELDDGADASAARRALRVLHGGARGATALEGALLLRDCGAAALNRGDVETARRRCELALPVVREHGAAAELVELLALLATACRRAVDLPAARACYDEAAERCNDLEPPGEAVATRSALLLELGEMCLVEMADPAAALGYLEGALVDCEEAGLLDRAVAVTRRLHQAATALGDAVAVRRHRAAAERATFVAAVAREASALAASAPGRVGDLPAMVFGDTGGRPSPLRIPGGRVSEGVIWRRRLAAEVRRVAPRHRVAVLRGRTSAESASAALAESLQLLVIEPDRLEARAAEVLRSDGVASCGAWLPAGDDGWPDGHDRLADALREALG